MSHNATKVIVAMSGGVDSSVAAYLLLKAGYQVEGMFMKNWEEADTASNCSATQDANDAQQVCDKLSIKLHKVNFANEYWENVFENFLSEYQNGRTPNPDILCNREIKFKVFLQYAEHLGADFIATGHYAGVDTDTSQDAQKKQYFLSTAADLTKDQTYFLYTLGQKQLSKVMFPLAAYQKSAIRQIAQENGLITYDKKDSTGICFIGETKFKEFLSNYLPNQPGDIVMIDQTGKPLKTIGRHDGLMYYTLGQRKGLHIGGLRESNEQPWYVVDKDLTSNQLFVAQGEHPLLYSSELTAEQLSFVQGSVPRATNDQEGFACSAKVRYRQNKQTCRVLFDDAQQTCRVIFSQPQRAVTPGQSIVFYSDNICLGGGIIATRSGEINE